MNSHWQEQLLALVDHYGQQCAQLAAERERGKHGNPPADRASAWAAILSHLAHTPELKSAVGQGSTQAA
jgi:hypothetical protein